MVITLTKSYRCNANPQRITYSDPYYFYSRGKTMFLDTFYPYYFETDDLAEMQNYVNANGIVYVQM